jgi:ribosomal subunit interface protein
MKVRVSGKHLEVGEALPEQVRVRLEAAVSKHFDGGAEASVTISKEGPAFRVDCNAHLDTGVVFQSEGTGIDAYHAFDAALVHLEKQLRRYKRRLKNHHEKAKAPKRAPA